MKQNYNKRKPLAIEQAETVVSSINEHRLAQIIEQCGFEKSLKASEELQGLKPKKNTLKKISMFMISARSRL